MRVALLAALLLALTACRGTMPIGRPLDDPGRHDGETVKIKGEVTGSAGALGQGAYRASAGTGTMNVLSRGRGAPREGAEVGVEGEFRSVFTLGDTSQAVILEERRFDP